MSSTLQTTEDGAALPRVAALDGVRGVAILLTLVFHTFDSTQSWGIVGERGVEAYRDVGLDPARLRVTGNPAWDDYSRLGRYRPELRATMAALHGLSTAAPIVVFGTTWSANLTALGDEGLYSKTLRAFLVSCKELHDQGVALQPVIKDRQTPESSAPRVHELAAELGLGATGFR